MNESGTSDYLEILWEAQDAIRGSTTIEEAQQRSRALLESALHAKKVQLRELQKSDAESRWAHDRGNALVLPGEKKGCRVVFPLRGQIESVHFLVETPLSTDQATTIARQILDRLVGVYEATVKNLRQNTLQTRERFLQDNILDSIPQSILAANEQGNIVVANINAEMLFGVRRIDILDEPLEEVLPEKIAPHLKELHQAVLADGRVHDREMDHTVHSTRLPIGVSASPLTLPGGKAGGVVFICRDMRLSREVQKLRELDAMKTEFVHTVSHELKTPLTAITGGVELLNLERASLKADQLELVDLIDQGAKRLQALIYDILAVSRLERGTVELKLAPVKLVEALEHFFQRLTPSDRKRVHVEKTSASSTVAAEADKLQEILENLISNALKYSPDDKVVDVRISASPKIITLEVQDKGIGIPAKDQKHIFSKFFRSEAARNFGKEGTGLGLAITQELVRLHNGRLTFKSKRGQGTTFMLELPVWKGQRNG